MHYRFNHQCTIKDFVCMEDIYNNAIYVIDPDTQQLRQAKNPDEYVTERLAFVYNCQDSIPLDDSYTPECILEKPVNRKIKKGTHCRCWMVCMQMV